MNDLESYFQELFHPQELQAMVVGNENYDFLELEKVSLYCMQGKFCPHFIFPLFALCSKGEFKTGLIGIFVKDYVRNFFCLRIQDWQISFRSVLGENKTGKFKAVYSITGVVKKDIVNKWYLLMSLMSFKEH